ncbi:toll/interleukin-1 receptor domain-containing protein [Aureibaculum conchae]|uniref:toll/interleukin-1 receptor domain-containing protein n=1 Tax=Aureibaculum sp. 2308TA14-22 TaxID=3108392 RepID=UPI00339448DE
MNLSLQQLYTRFTEHMDTMKAGFTMTTNNDMGLKFFDNEGNETKYVPFKGSAIVKVMDSCKHYAIFIDSFGEEIINKLPIIIEGLEKDGMRNVNMVFENLEEGDYATKNEDLLFTGKFYIETNKLTLTKEKAFDLINKMGIRYKGRKIKFIIRDNNDWKKLKKPERIKIFLCHDSRDKKYVEQVYMGLIRKTFDPWLDKVALQIGDSLIDKIGEGLNQADFAIIFVSKYFLSNEKWVKFELQSLMTKQVTENKKVILPLWLDIKADDLKNNLWLRDKVAVNSNDGLESVIDKIVRSTKLYKEKNKD